MTKKRNCAGDIPQHVRKQLCQVATRVIPQRLVKRINNNQKRAHRVALSQATLKRKPDQAIEGRMSLRS